MGAELLKDEYAKVFNIDYSEILIEQMKKKYLREIIDNKMEFLCADITCSKEMQHYCIESTFKLIVCKATMDSILCANNAEYNVNKMMEQCLRLLDKSGILIVVSYDENRLKYFDEHVWDVSVKRVPKLNYEIDGTEHGEDYFFYVCAKKA